MFNIGNLFKKIEGGFNKVAPGIVAVVDTIDPAVAPLVNLIYNGILRAESIQTADNANKKQLVLDEVNNAVPLLQAGLAAAGKTVDAAKVTSAASEFNDAYVAFMKAYANVATAVSGATVALPAAVKA